MSELVRSLNEQPEDRKDIGEAFKKLLGDIPVVKYDEERRRHVIEQQTERLKELANAQSKGG